VSDIRLFDISGKKPREIPGKTVDIEKEIQTLVENNLEAFFSTRFLASEYSTGNTHSGRIDTLGIDENNSPVIIEYKRSRNDNVIIQGLYYLDWLLDHKSEFEILVQDKLSDDTAVDWSAPRLFCIAGGYNKFDIHATRQIDRNIDLVRYEIYEDSHIVFELTSNEEVKSTVTRSASSASKISPSDRIGKSPESIKQMWSELEEFILALGDDVNMVELDKVIAFKTERNFVCGHVFPIKKRIRLTISIDPDSITLEEGFSSNIKGISRWGTGDVEVDIESKGDLEKAKPMIEQAYREVSRG
jgi:predicted transport protein